MHNKIDQPDTTQPNMAREKSIVRPVFVLSLVYALFGPVAAFAKMGTVPLLIIATFAQTSFSCVRVELAKALGSGPGMCFIALFAWCAMSNIWGETNTLLTLARLPMVVILAYLVVVAANNLNCDQRDTVCKIIVSTSLVLVAVLLIEGLSGASLHKLLRPEDAAPREGEWVPYLELVAARGTAILAPLCFLVAPLISRFSGRAFLGVAFIGLSLVSTAVLPMAASSLAIFVGAFFALMARLSARATLAIFFAGLAIGTLSSPWLVSELLPNPNSEKYDALFDRNEQQRVAIWSYVTELVFDKPILGHGFDSSRQIGSRGDTVAGTNWPALPLHPHNAALQVWLELGAVGIALAIGLMFFAWQALDRYRSQSRDIAPAVGCLAALSTLALISFGVWQFWWIATWGLLAGVWTLSRQNAA